MAGDHSNGAYESELRALEAAIGRMGKQVQGLLRGSVRSVVERDSDVAIEMIAIDHTVDAMERDIDERCMHILARRHPVASDLRLVTAAMKMVTDLERIGDLGVNICERAIELNAEPPLKPYLDLPNMCAIVLAMLGGALTAFAERNASSAERVVDLDSIVDAYFAQIMRELLTYMMEDVHNVPRGIRVQAIAKHVERAGDHAANLARHTIFMIRGTDVRHGDRRG